MMLTKTERSKEEQRVMLTRQFLQQKSLQAALSMDEEMFIAYKLGVSLGQAARYINLVRES